MRLTLVDTSIPVVGLESSAGSDRRLLNALPYIDRTGRRPCGVILKMWSGALIRIILNLCPSMIPLAQRTTLWEDWNLITASAGASRLPPTGLLPMPRGYPAQADGCSTPAAVPCSSLQERIGVTISARWLGPMPRGECCDWPTADWGGIAARETWFC